MTHQLARTFVALLFLAVLAGVAPRDGAAALLPPTLVTAAGAGVFPATANWGGVQLSGGTFGQGMAVNADGSARGDFQTILAGTSLLGATTRILVVGWATAGTANADGSVSISGTCRVDMGDGSAPSVGVPFTATITAAGFQLTVGATVLPTLMKNGGWIYIETPSL